MKSIWKFGGVLVLGAAMALAASGCGGASTKSTGGGAAHRSAVAARGGVAQERAAAIATVKAHVESLDPGARLTFAASRAADGEWKVSFQGQYIPQSPGFKASLCKGAGAKAGQVLYLTVYSSGFWMVSANGRHRVSPFDPYGTTATGPTFTCPAAG